ncbi:MAG: DUF1918 domain-containing protein [Acidimicrobiales bacterium]|jgi:hypothetical protein
MDANVGDRIVVRGHRTGQPVRACLVVEVRGSRGGAPYLVRWDDSGHETLFFPGSDATVEHADRAS